MFERFTERARQVVVLAQEEARGLKHNYIGTEHILLGLLREGEGIAARVLESLDITVDGVRGQVVGIVGTGEEPTAGQIPFTPRAKKVLELALSEAQALGHDHIATEHLLLGLLRENEGVGARALRELGADADGARAQVFTVLGASPASEPPRATEGAQQLLAGMYARFTERSRRVVVRGQEEARALKHPEIGTEHILLGLLGEGDGIAAEVLASLDITDERVRAQVSRVVGSDEDPPPGELPLASRTKKLFELALREALSLGQNYIGTEHILLAIVRDRECLAAHIALDFGADLEKVRDDVLHKLRVPGRSQPQRAQADPNEPSAVRIGLSDELLDGAGPPLRTLAREVEERLGRAADAGDLLLLLAVVPDGLVARTLSALGADAESLVTAVEGVRRDAPRSALLPSPALLAEADGAHAEAEEALARERDLRKQAREGLDERNEQLLAEVRARLGLGEA